MPGRTTFGFGFSCDGDFDDPAHRECCLLCQSAWRGEQRRLNPGRFMRWIDRVLSPRS